jgi:hypothetical protein
MSFRRIAAALASVVALAICIPLRVGTSSAAEAGLVVHEWGTFTTRHGPDGTPVAWTPLVEVSDLPRFVNQDGGPKSTIAGTVRMETPVIYFYAPSRRTVAVDVGFPGGTITEWYPRARVRPEGIAWPRVTILPGVPGRLRHGKTESHYYAARATDADVVRVRAAGRTQHEKFLFYRGVGTFSLPVRARRDGAQIVVDVDGAHPASEVMIFERHGDAVGHDLVTLAGTQTSVSAPVLSAVPLAPFEETLRGWLLGAGLYEAEAQAMLDTRRTTWTEDGLRVFYLVPREVTDAVLPLSITPPPAELVRVLIGRADVLDELL